MSLQTDYPMSLTIAGIAVKGLSEKDLPRFFSCFQLVDAGRDEVLSNWRDAEKIIEAENLHPDDHVQKRILWFDNGWSIIEDSSLIVCSDEEALSQASQLFQTRVFSFVAQESTGSFGFWHFNNEQSRHFFVRDGAVTSDEGNPIPEEQGLSINKNAGLDDILALAGKLGINWNRSAQPTRYIVKELCNSPALDAELERFAPKQGNPELPRTKPWWKFW